jgi:Electron transfer DM13
VTTTPVPPAAGPGFVRRHRFGVLGIGVGGLAVVAWLAFGYFGVQALWVDDEVDEAAPVFDSGVTAPEAPSSTVPTSAPPSPAEDEPVIETVVIGRFIERDHATAGTAAVLTDGSEQRFLRFTDFATDNGPDVNVYLSTAAPDGESGSFDDDFVDLGDLTGNIGDQNYEIPPGVDLDRYRTVVLWCVRFGVPFGAAELG